MRNWRFFLIGCLLLGMLLAHQPAAAQVGDGRYFPEMNKWVRGDFLKFYLSIPNPDLMLGYPISDEITIDGGKVQYFERGRIDQIIDGKSSRIKLANLGWMMWTPDGARADVPEFSATCRFFPITGKWVCFDFLKFYDAHNGAVYFGNPITNIEMRNGGYVQYFENVRLEFRAYLPFGKQIVIADLGREAYLKYVGSLPPIPQKKPEGWIGPRNPALNGVHAHAYVSVALASVQSKQTVFVVVQDQDSNPVEGAKVNLTLEYPNGRKEQIVVGLLTNADGIFKTSFTIEKLNIDEIVKIQVQAEYQGESFPANTWFRIWY